MQRIEHLDNNFDYLTNLWAKPKTELGQTIKLKVSQALKYTQKPLIASTQALKYMIILLMALGSYLDGIVNNK